MKKDTEKRREDSGCKIRRITDLVEEYKGRYEIRQISDIPAKFTIVEVKNKPKAGDMNDTLIKLYNLKVQVIREQMILREWSRWIGSEGVMDTLRDQYLTSKRRNINYLIRNIQQGTYTIEK